MSYTIQLVGAVGGHSPFSATDISRLLESDSAALAHGETFTGRPATCLYVGTETVGKVRTEIRLDLKSALRWAQQALDKEQTWLVHHPHKTWFVATHNETPDETPLIGNICPRLTPLHTLCQTSDPEPPPTERLGYLHALFDLYCRTAAEHAIRLDEGLSNFGTDANGKVYYLDDDSYNWDRFVSCAHILGVFFRSMAWLDQTYATRFGAGFRELLTQYFTDTQYAVVLAEQLRDIFMPSEAHREVLHCFSDALTHHHITRMEAGTDYYKGDRYLGLIADVHANLPALDTVLSYLKMKNIEHALMLGDIVGYGPDPAECIERLRQTEFLIVKGNHDHGLATGNYRKGFSRTAHWALDWSAPRVSAEQKAWLADLPPVLHGEGWLALHGAPVDPTFFNAYVYEMTYERNLDHMQQKNLPLCFHGHTHLQGVYARKPGRSDQHYLVDTFALDSFPHNLVCPGSIGQPRDGRVGAQFAIYDLEQREMHFHVLNYDVAKTADRMEQMGFPDTLVNILRNTQAH